MDRSGEGADKGPRSKIRMSHVILGPRITLEAEASEAHARELVAKAHDGCCIADSVSTPVEIAPTFVFADQSVAAS